MTRSGVGTDPSAGASAQAIRKHYDVGNAFYEAWLDRSMTYSAGRWSTIGHAAITLEDAQTQKLDWHLDAASVAPGARILDVGCGWGSLLVRAVRQRHVAQAVGLTPSRDQRDWIRDRYGDAGIETICSRWQDANAGKDFDAIFSLGSLEHFARPGLASSEKVRAYEQFFEFCRRSISDEGRLSVQFIAWMDIEPGSEIANLPTELFPESNLPRVSEIIGAAEPTFHPILMENSPDDYARTIREWLSRLNDARDDLIKECGADLVKAYIRGFRRFLLGFETGTLGLYRLAFRPRKTGR